MECRHQHLGQRIRDEPGNLGGARSGIDHLVGGDGATHQGVFDLSFLRTVPNMTIMAPADENECRQMLYTATRLDGPAAVRYPRGTGPGVQPVAEMSALPLGRGIICREGRSGLAILAFGTMLGALAPIAEKFDATLVNMRFVKPLDEDLLRQLADRHESFVTAEENALAGGAGAAVLEVLSEHGYVLPVLRLGIPDRFIAHGSRADNLAAAGLDAATLAQRIERFWLPRQRRA